VAVMAVNNAYGEGLSKVITDQLPAKIYTQYALKSDGSNLDAELKRANGDDPDVLILAAPASLAGTAVAKLAGHSNLAAAQLYLSDSTHNPDFLQKAGGTAKLASVQGTLPGAPVSKVFKTFQGNYISSFTDDPAQQSFTAHSYDAAYCLALAHAWAMGSAGDGKVNGKALAGGLRQLSNVKAQDFQLAPTNFIPMRSLLMKGDPVDIEGASGLLDFDPDKGEAPSPVGIWEIDDKGAFKAVKWVEVQGSGADSQVVELP